MSVPRPAWRSAALPPAAALFPADFFLAATGLPFLPTPMGKGVVPDDHPNSVAPARSHALREADLIVLIGARLNWILHFGLAPRFADDVKVVQIDIEPEEIGSNVPTEAALVGAARQITAQLNAALEAEPWSYSADTPWQKEPSSQPPKWAVR